ncbi:DNA sulfur modification protein DndE [Streptomyces sp. SID8366]|uniref:DNA sulfur modification protein DndE n=1 Tax=unclassified Streptomyces TaxID=2593676 RepID=UPI000DB91A94|nr:DNA sulfur modification protein DndE [Streptomyces sp. PsTaAH-130]MYU08360.1 DNA sulfur modification protein DndE [Streptomyces sp. SID8366]MYU67050.1 DNA sulfur modification protein DndE [Streptomyces sp. SID69]RAJ62738.1 DNA sulfur modification protein DndE [Streptomyces sp. PsTaAH-130]
MSLETVRLSQTAKDQLVWLKRHTGISHWNVLCRWALALSLRDPSTPLVRDIVTDSNVEMSWKTFAGAHGDIYLALLKQRCLADGEEATDEAVSRTLLVHIHRGVGYLHGRRDLKSISKFVQLAVA